MHLCPLLAIIMYLNNIILCLSDFVQSVANAVGPQLYFAKPISDHKYNIYEWIAHAYVLL